MFATTVSSLALVLSAALGSTPAQAPAPEPVAQIETVHGRVAAYFADIPIMIRISGCESHFRQFDTDGSVYRGEQNHHDIGVMQINETYHLDAAKALGYDIYTIDGNLGYARYLYEHYGTAPWDSSAACWDTKYQQEIQAAQADEAAALAAATSERIALAQK